MVRCGNCDIELERDDHGKLCFRCSRLFRNGYLKGRQAAAQALMDMGYGQIEYSIARGGETR